MGFFEIVIVIITFPVSFLAWVIDVLFHTGFWTAWWIVLILTIIAGAFSSGEEE